MYPTKSGSGFRFGQQTPINSPEKELGKSNSYDADLVKNQQVADSELNGHQTLNFNEPSTEDKGFIEGYWEQGKPIGDMKSVLLLSDKTVTYEGEMGRFNQHYDCHGKGTKKICFQSGVAEVWDGEWKEGKFSIGKKTRTEGDTCEVTHYTD